MFRWLQDEIFQGAQAVFARIPHRARWRCATIAARIVSALRISRIRIAEDNIRSAYPEYSDEQVKRLAFESARNLFQVFFEMPFLAYAAQHKIFRIIETENAEVITRLLQERKNAVFISGHFGNWELSALSGPMFLQCPLTIVGQVQRSERVNLFLNVLRHRFGNDVIPMEGAIRRMMRLLAEGKSIALLADQGASQQEIVVNFFNRPAPTYTTAAALALRYNVPLIFGTAIRKDNLTYKVSYREIPSSDLCSATEENIRILTERHVQALETVIREYPGQWLWLHRRWKRGKSEPVA